MHPDSLVYDCNVEFQVQLLYLILIEGCERSFTSSPLGTVGNSYSDIAAAEDLLLVSYENIKRRHREIESCASEALSNATSAFIKAVLTFHIISLDCKAIGLCAGTVVSHTDMTLKNSDPLV